MGDACLEHAFSNGLGGAKRWSPCSSTERFDSRRLYADRNPPCSHTAGILVVGSAYKRIRPRAR